MWHPHPFPRSASQFVAHVHEVDPLGGRVVAVAPGVGLREFTFDHVFPANGSQVLIQDRNAYE